MSNDNNENRNKIRRKKVSSSANSTASTSSKRKSRSSNKNDKFKILRVTGIIFLVLLVVGAAAGTGLVFASLKDVKPVTRALLDEKTFQTTKIRYATGDLLSNAPTVNKKEPLKELDQISKDLQNAIVAIEDERFYEHKGVDIKGLARSVVKTLMGKKQGGSTIPMQVSKMLLTTQQQTLPRKIKDIYYAYEMSKTLSKEDILLAYLNNFPVGSGFNGAEAGARGYFDKPAVDLELEEAALLAGATKNPFSYSAYITGKIDGSESKEELENKLLYYIYTPDSNFDAPTKADFEIVDKLKSMGLITDDSIYKQLKSGTMVVRKAVNNPKAKKRQEIVLGKMLELKYITQAEHDEAVAAPINIKLPKSAEKVSSSLEDFIEYEVIDALMEHGNTKDEAYNLFRNGGLEIRTTIDPKMQNILEEEYDDNNNFPGNKPGPDGILQPQSAMVILDYRNGQIKSLVGGRHITGRKALNRATYPQQPGSTIKPLSVYTPAIDAGMTQSDLSDDRRGNYKFDHGGWNPGTTTPAKGFMSLRKALAYSSNTIAIRTAEALGDTYQESIDIMLDYLRNFGFTTLVDTKAGDKKSSDRNFSALTLGGMTNGTKPLEMAAAYGALANSGVYIEPTVFTTISTYDGQLLIQSRPEEVKVVEPEVAYVITDMLSAVITEGIGGSASISSGMAVAGKTGTTNGGLDAWFVGYTPYYVAATYIGDDAGKKDPNTGETIKRRAVSGSSDTSAKLWSKIMSKIHNNFKVIDKFKAPDNVYFTKIDPDNGGKSPVGSSAAFIKGTAPTRVSTPVVEEPKEEEKPKEEETPEENTPTEPSTTPETPTPPTVPPTIPEAPTPPTTPAPPETPPATDVPAQ